MDEVATWVRHVATRLKEEKLMLPQGGPVMLVQLENEYSMVSDAYGDAGGKYLQWCADLQKELEFGVPGVMCYGAAEGVVETINSFYAHEEIDGHRQRHADQPPVWTECWTGWYNVWGAAKHVRKAEDLAYAVARWFAQGGAGVNYYMWMGGTNFERGAMYLQATSYGYDAPVNEFYQETSKMRHLARLHRVLKGKFERAFMATRDQDAECEGGTVYRWGDAVFVCNDSDEQLTDVCIEGVEGKYTGVVAAKSVSIIDGFSGELLYDSSSIHGDDVVTQELVAVPVVAGDWASMSEPVPSWDSIEAISEANGGESRPVVSGASPPDQLMLTQDSSDFCFYVAQYRSVGEGKGKRKVEFEAGDYATVFCDGKMQGQTKEPLWEDRWANKWNAYPDGEAGTGHCIEIETKDEAVEVCILTSSLGLVKGDWQLGSGRNMLGERKGLLSDVAVEGYERASSWKAMPKLNGEVCAWKTDGDGVGFGWHECVVRVEERKENWVLDLSGCGKGLLYVNGVLLGRYWLVAGTREMNGFLDGSPVRQVGRGESTQRYYHVPGWVTAGEREGDVLRVRVFVEAGERPAAVRLLSVEVDD